MSNTKIKLGTVKVLSVTEQSFKERQFFAYCCEDGSTFNSTTRFEVGDTVIIYLIKYKGSLNLIYSHSSE